MQIIPKIMFDQDNKKFYIVTALHKKGGKPKTKYDCTADVEHILQQGINAYVKMMRERYEAEANADAEKPGEDKEN